MIHINERNCPENEVFHTSLVDAMHESLDPLSALYRTLDKAEDGSHYHRIALLIATLLDNVADDQQALCEYLESKVGKITFTAKKSEENIFPASRYYVGLRIEKDQQ